jgi:hypothetical protein
MRMRKVESYSGNEAVLRFSYTDATSAEWLFSIKEKPPGKAQAPTRPFENCSQATEDLCR